MYLMIADREAEGFFLSLSAAIALFPELVTP